MASNSTGSQPTRFQVSPLSHAGMSSGRMLSLDALRGLAVFLMIEQHLGAWLWSQSASETSDWIIASFALLIMLGGMAAPLFVTLAGIGCSFFVYYRLGRGINPDVVLWRRGLTLLALGYLLSVMTPSWFSVRSWFVLHMIGFGIMLGPLLRRMNNAVLLLLAAVVIGGAGVVQFFFETPLALSNSRMAGWNVVLNDSQTEYMKEVIPYAHFRIAFAEGQFPVIPWLALFIVGMYVGRCLVMKEITKVTKLSMALIGVGLMLVFLFAIKFFEPQTMFWRIAYPFSFYPLSSTLACLLLGVVLLTIVLTVSFEHRCSFCKTDYSVVLGRASLTLLFFHVVLFREILPSMGIWQSLTVLQTILVTIMFVGSAIIAVRYWEKKDYRFGAEWLLRKSGGLCPGSNGKRRFHVSVRN